MLSIRLETMLVPEIFFSFQLYLSPFYSWITLIECLLGPNFCVWLFLLVAKNLDLLPGEIVSCKLWAPNFLLMSISIV